MFHVPSSNFLLGKGKNSEAEEGSGIVPRAKAGAILSSAPLALGSECLVQPCYCWKHQASTYPLCRYLWTCIGIQCLQPLAEGLTDGAGLLVKVLAVEDVRQLEGA